jgi:hypothetical protein
VANTRNELIFPLLTRFIDVRRNFKIDEEAGPLAALLTKYEKPEAGKAVSIGICLD